LQGAANMIVLDVPIDFFGGLFRVFQQQQSEGVVFGALRFEAFAKELSEFEARDLTLAEDIAEFANGGEGQRAFVEIGFVFPHARLDLRDEAESRFDVHGHCDDGELVADGAHVVLGFFHALFGSGRGSLGEKRNAGHQKYPAAAA